MAGKFLTMDEAAEQLGIDVDKLKQMRQDQKVHGYRDGQSWKFKPDEIDRVKGEISASADPVDLDDIPIELDSENDVVLLSEVELGESGPGTSSTVIGKSGQPADDESDIRVIAHDEKDDDLGSAETMVGGPKSDVQLVPEDEIELDLGGESDLPIDLGSLELSPVEGPSDSTVDLTGEGKSDDDQVLGNAGGTDSDITIGGGDSGISLIDPADSGLSLEEPLDLSGGSDPPLDLGGEQAAELEEVAEDEPMFELAGDDEFLLTPMEDASEEESDDSGSQVIALDESGEFDDAAAALGASDVGMGDMLEEEAGEALVVEEVDTDVAPILASTAAQTTTAPVAREAQYSVWQIISLSGCIVILSLSGMMMYDLTQNMWSWSGTTPLSSSIMDGIIGLFES